MIFKNGTLISVIKKKICIMFLNEMKKGKKNIITIITNFKDSSVYSDDWREIPQSVKVYIHGWNISKESLRSMRTVYFLCSKHPKIKKKVRNLNLMYTYFFFCISSGNVIKKL